MTVVNTIIAMIDDLKTKCEQTFYSELYHFEETSQGLLLDKTTGHIYLKKTLDTYDKDVYGWLKANHNIHIPAIHSFWEENGKLIVLEEYIQGETLDSLMSKTSLAESERIRIILDVCDALTFLHSAVKPIIHRDIKPSNIMLTSEGIVKLIDYDAAKVFHNGKKEDTTLIGTVGRAAPEQYGFAQSDARTDVYSMGCLIRELFPSDGRYSAIIAKSTAMDPKDRYQTVAELKAAVSGNIPKVSGKRNLIWIIIPIIVSVLGICILMALVGFYIGRRSNSDRIVPTPEKVPEKTEDISEIEDDSKVEPLSDAIEELNKDDTDTINDTSADTFENEEGFTIGETCWFISGSSPDGYVHYGAILENTSQSKSVRFPVVRVTAKDKKGNILGTDEMTGGAIMPGDHIVLSSLFSLSEFDSASDVSVEFSAASGEAWGDTDRPKSSDFVIDKISEKEDDLFPSVMGEITSKYNEPVSIALTVLLRNKGKLVGCDTTYVNNLKPGVPTAFEVDISNGSPKHDSVEVMVQEW